MKTKLLFISGLFLSGVLCAQPTPFASFSFDTDFLDAQENVTTSLIGTTLPVIADDPVRGKVAFFAGGANSVGTAVSMSLNSYAFTEATYNVWINVLSLDTWSRFFTFGTEAASGTADEFWSTPANGRLSQRMSVTIDNGSDDPGVEVPFSDETIETERWYMFTAALSATHCKLWVDGVVAGDSLCKGSGSTAADRTIEVAYLGKSVWPDPILHGSLDNFKIFDSYLSDADVLALYNAEKIETGVKPVSKDLNFTVYTEGNQIIVKNPDNAQINAVMVYNLAGSLMIQTTKFNGVLNHNLPSSLYIVKIQSNKGEYTTKISVK
jgi:Concanavalin A-like lectin/glucanases superfamily